MRKAEERCTHAQRRSKVWLSILTVTQLGIYAWITLLSFQFSSDSDGQSRPILMVIGLLAVAFMASLCSVALAIRLSHCRTWVTLFFLVAILARGIVLFSEPIQEVDLYRYIWDGAVSGEGFSPYEMRPSDVTRVLDAMHSLDEVDEQKPFGTLLERKHSTAVSKMGSLAAEQPGLAEVLRRVHYAELPTVYPPVSQAVFRMSNGITPNQASLKTRVRIIKAVILLFDIGVMVLLYKLLSITGINTGWCTAYGWSPLVIKEFANSGHLDSIAVFFVMASIVCMVLACRTLTHEPPRFSIRMAGLFTSASCLGLGVGAKLFPVVFFPVMAVYLAKRLGIRFSVIWLITACMVSGAVTAPMLIGNGESLSSDRLQGLSAFLRYWEINDFVFMVVEENIRPENSVPNQPRLWFTFIPASWRNAITVTTSQWLGLSHEGTPFLLTRMITSLVYLAIVATLCVKTWRQSDQVAQWLFLSVAWFWMLSPTQNPWYWTWALPMVPFALNRGWLVVSGVVLTYYLRFWFQYHNPMWGAYQGTQVFDFIIVWLEFIPLLIALLWFAPLGTRSGR